MKTLISVLTICRDNLGGLRETVASMAAQTVQPDEFIVLDGASRDGTVEFLNICTAVTFWKSEPDRGIADAFNKAARLAHGEWLLFLNAGDALADAKVLADVRAELEKLDPAKGVCFGDALVVDPEGLAASYRQIGSLGIGHGGNTICHQAAFVRRTLQLQFPYDDRLRIGMDYDFWQRLQPVTEFAHMDRVICAYRLGGISSSRKWAEHAIVAHHLVDWLNSRRRLGLRDVLSLLKAVLVLRVKKVAERLLGRKLYARVRNLKGRD